VRISKPLVTYMQLHGHGWYWCPGCRTHLDDLPLPRIRWEWVRGTLHRTTCCSLYCLVNDKTTPHRYRFSYRREAL
jgi:hypothetical protein